MSPQDQSPSIFESFNARNLAPSQVARTFVPQEQYARLSRRCHSMLIGPRGSGKTTLLKMLQPQALEAWQHQKGPEYRKRIDFTGVFVATDVSWGRQREALGGGKLDDESRELFGQAIFTTHVLKAVVSCMLFRTSRAPECDSPYRRVATTPDKEIQLVQTLAQAWRVRPLLPSLVSLKLALLQRLSEIRESAAKEALLGSKGRSERIANLTFLHLQFIESVSLATNAFNSLLDEADGKWALLFDELELAPKWIIDQLVMAVRSVDETLLFKLAMSPVSTYEYPDALRQVSGPAAGQDFESIPLWYVEKHEPYQFCEDLWYRMLSEKGLPRLAPQAVLGESYSDQAKEERRDHGSAYHPQSKIARSFQRLASKDSTFRQYLSERNIDPKHLDQLVPKKGDEIVRKIAPLVLFRDYFRGREETDKATKRSRKVLDIYSGAESIFAITEGNPRWFIGMLGGLLDGLSESLTQISPKTQAHAISETADRFLAMLRTIPTAQPVQRGRPLTIDAIVEKIGKHFEERAIVAPFVAEPPATFRFPMVGLDRNLRSSLDKAVNAGALVYVPDDGSELFLKSITGKRFRLSYLLAPLYHLPLRLGTEISLQTVLNDSTGTVAAAGDLLGSVP